MSEFKIVVAGSRSFNDFELLKSSIDYLIFNLNLTPQTKLIIISGGAKGADNLGELYGKLYGYEIEIFIPDWSIGKYAGIIRNKKMAEVADACIVFWDGKSNGSKNMIEQCKKKGIRCDVIKF